MFNNVFFSRDVNATFARINQRYGSMFRYDHLEKKKRENNVKKSREDFTIFRAKQKVSNVAILSRM